MSRRPTDLRFGESIVGAFAQGRAEALERLRNKQVQDQLAVENEQAKQRAEEQRRQFEAQLSQRQLEFDAEQKLAELGYNLNKTKGKIDIEGALRDIVKQGGIPSGYSPNNLPGLNEQVRQMPTIFGEPAFEQELLRFQKQAGQSDLLPEQIIERNPAAVAREKTMAARQEEINKFKLAQQTAEEAQRRTQENELFKTGLPISVEKQAELDQAMKIARMNNDRALEVARINAKESAGSLSSLAQAYLQNPDLIFDTTVGTPKTRGEAIAELAGLGYNVRSNQQKTVQELAPRTLGLINDILDDKEFSWGLGSMLKVIPGTKALDSDLKMQSLRAALTVPEIKYIKGLGAMSDADREFISNIPAKLNTGLSAEAGKKELARLKTIYEKVIKAEVPLVNKNKPDPASFDRSK